MQFTYAEKSLDEWLASNLVVLSTGAPVNLSAVSRCPFMVQEYDRLQLQLYAFLHGHKTASAALHEILGFALLDVVDDLRDPRHMFMYLKLINNDLHFGGTAKQFSKLLPVSQRITFEKQQRAALSADALTL